MTNIGILLNRRIPENYAFCCPETGLHLDVLNPCGSLTGGSLKTTTNIQMAYTTLTEPNKVQIKTIKKTLLDNFYLYELMDVD